jgi:hypothetical protein
MNKLFSLKDGSKRLKDRVSKLKIMRSHTFQKTIYFYFLFLKSKRANWLLYFCGGKHPLSKNGVLTLKIRNDKYRYFNYWGRPRGFIHRF